MPRAHARCTLFPYTTLFRSRQERELRRAPFDVVNRREDVDELLADGSASGGAEERAAFRRPRYRDLAGDALHHEEGTAEHGGVRLEPEDTWSRNPRVAKRGEHAKMALGVGDLAQNAASAIAPDH